MSEFDVVKQAILEPLQAQLSSPVLAEEAANVAVDVLMMGVLEATMIAMTGGDTDGLGMKSAPRVAKLMVELLEKAQLSCLTPKEADST